LGVAARSRTGAALILGLAFPVGALAAHSPRLAVAGVLGLGFVFLAAYDVAAGVAIFFILAVLEPIPPISGSPAVKLAGAVLVVLLLQKDAPLLRLPREHPAIASAAVCFVIWAGVSSLWATAPGIAISSAARLALGVIFLFVVYGAIHERHHVRWLTYALIAAALIASFTGLIGISAYGAGSEQAGRLVGAAGNPNELASILVPALALGAFAVVSGQSPRFKALVGASLVAIAFALALTGSRGGLVAFIVALIAAVIFGGIYRTRILALVLIVVTLGVGYYGVIASSAARDRVVHIGAGGGAGRSDIWNVARLVIENRPLFGVGLGNFPVVEPPYAAATINIQQLPFIIDTPKVVHNTYLEIQAELGIPGSVAFLFVVAATFTWVVRAIRAAESAGDRELEFLSRGVLVALVGYLAAATFGSREYEKPLWLLLGLAVAMSTVVSRSVPSERRASDPV
jgi:O-antigen ligase